MKLSVSLPDDVEYLDSYVAAHGLESRSAALRRAVRLLRSSELGAAYEDALADWTDSKDSCDWEAATADGLTRCDGARSARSTSTVAAAADPVTTSRPRRAVPEM